VDLKPLTFTVPFHADAGPSGVKGNQPSAIFFCEAEVHESVIYLDGTYFSCLSEIEIVVIN
jgi:hypothetical protein